MKKYAEDYAHMSDTTTVLTPLNAHLWERHPEDFYVEPEWCSRRLFEEVLFDGSVLDPACGLGRVVESAHKCGLVAFGADIIARSPICRAEENFFHKCYKVENIVSNPPFSVAEAFTRHALQSVMYKLALLLPSKWLYGYKRSLWLETTPLRTVLALAPRPSMPPGHVIAAGIDPGGGRYDFAWFIWEIGYRGRPELSWLRRDK